MSIVFVDSSTVTSTLSDIPNSDTSAVIVTFSFSLVGDIPNTFPFSSNVTIFVSLLLHVISYPSTAFPFLVRVAFHVFGFPTYSGVLQSVILISKFFTSISILAFILFALTTILALPAFTPRTIPPLSYFYNFFIFTAPYYKIFILSSYIRSIFVCNFTF